MDSAPGGGGDAFGLPVDKGGSLHSAGRATCFLTCGRGCPRVEAVTGTASSSVDPQVHRRCAPWHGLCSGRTPGWYCVGRSYSMLFCILPTGAGPACAQVNHIDTGAHFFSLSPGPAYLTLSLGGSPYCCRLILSACACGWASGEVAEAMTPDTPELVKSVLTGIDGPPWSM